MPLVQEVAPVEDAITDPAPDLETRCTDTPQVTALDPAGADQPTIITVTKEVRKEEAPTKEAALAPNRLAALNLPAAPNLQEVPSTPRVLPERAIRATSLMPTPRCKLMSKDLEIHPKQA